MRAPVATATTTKTSVKTYLAIAAIGGASFAAAMFMAIGKSGALAIWPANPSPDSQIVEGQDDVLALSFNMAGKKKDILVEALHFEIMGEADGDLSSIEAGINVLDYIENCSLYQNGVLNAAAGAVPPTLGEIVFQGASILVPQNALQSFEVRCNFANAVGSHSTPYAFALKLPNDTFITAEEATSGNALTSAQIFAGAEDAGVNVSFAQEIAMWEYGTIAIERDPTEPSDDIVIAGTSDVPAGSWLLTPRGEDVEVDTLTFTFDPAVANNISAVRVDIDNGQDSLSLLSFPVNGAVTFRNLGKEIFIDTPATVSVMVNTSLASNVPFGSGTSGEIINFSLDAANLDTFDATGTISGHRFTETDTGVSMRSTTSLTYRYTEPVVTLSAVSPSGIKVPGSQETLRFIIAAHTAENVEINSLAFKINATDNASSGWNECTNGAVNALVAADFSIYNLTTAPATALDIDSDWLLADQNRAACSVIPADIGYAIVRLSTPIVIPAGATQTFSVNVDSSGASSSQDDSLRLDIPATALDSNDILINGLLWDDGSGLSISGFLVDALPINGGTLAF